MNEEEVAKTVRLSTAEKVVLADEAKRLRDLIDELFVILEEEEDTDVATRIRNIWNKVGFPINYISTVLNMRFHEAVHQQMGGGHDPDC